MVIDQLQDSQDEGNGWGHPVVLTCPPLEQAVHRFTAQFRESGVELWEESVAGHGHVVDQVGTPPLVDEVEDGASQAPLVVRVKSAQLIGFSVVNTW